jgi:thiol-disulfide isomerase/thioredoxin
MPSLQGNGTISLTSVAGRPIVLNFWSSTCAPCKSETPDLASAARALAGKVTFVGVDTADGRAAAIAFTAKYRVPYQNVFDPNVAVATKYGVVALPVTFFISPSGTRILGENLGALSTASLNKILHELYNVS